MKLKTKLAMALSLIFAAGTSSAAIDLEATSPATVTIASEADIDTVSGTVITNAASMLDVTGEFGWGMTSSNDYFVRIDLTDATFDTTLLAAALDIGVGVGTVSVASTGSDYIIFTLTAATSIAATDTFTLDVTDLKVMSQKDVKVQYRLFSSDIDAVNEVNSLSSKTATILQFKQAIDASGGVGSDKKSTSQKLRRSLWAVGHRKLWMLISR